MSTQEAMEQNATIITLIHCYYYVLQMWRYIYGKHDPVSRLLLILLHAAAKQAASGSAVFTHTREGAWPVAAWLSCLVLDSWLRDVLWPKGSVSPSTSKQAIKPARRNEGTFAEAVNNYWEKYIPPGEITGVLSTVNIITWWMNDQMCTMPSPFRFSLKIRISRPSTFIQHLSHI